MSVKLVVIGSNGLVGSRLSSKLQSLTKFHVSPTAELPVAEIVLFDMAPPAKPEDQLGSDPRIKILVGDLGQKQDIQDAIQPNGATHVVVFHLAAVLSGYAEENFDLGIKVNIHGTLNIMNCIRNLKEQNGMPPQRYVYCSSDYVCCFNEANRQSPVGEESFRLSPVSYGVQKACMELLISDYTRRGFLDGRVARLSAVIGRPGWSNSVSYPFTGIFTQTLESRDYDVPLPMDIPYPCSSLVNNLDCLVYMAGQLDGDKLGHNRVIQVPAKSWTLKQIWEATQEVAQEEGVQLGKIKSVTGSAGTTTVKEINVCPYVDCRKAELLGLPMNVDLKAVIRDYVFNYIKK